MESRITINEEELRVDLEEPLDISILLKGDGDNLTAWYMDPPEISPVINEHFVGSVKKGGVVNFRNIFLNPHAHGTHTECVGHISKEDVYLHEVLKNFYFKSQVISIEPEEQNNGDRIITKRQLEKEEIAKGTTAIIIRTLPNELSKRNRQYSNTNPPYFEPEAMAWLRSIDILHVLTDLPSVDREEDGGNLLSHKSFWNYPEQIDRQRTITEFVYVDDSIEDGNYLLELQSANFKNDASPSRPVLYKIINP